MVICYGDSWTWGDSLGQSCAATGSDDFEFRSQNVYGYHVAHSLNADFVNFAIPGIYNYWVHDRLKILIDHDMCNLSSKYNKIYIIVTLTELGRDFVLDKYTENFKEFYDYTNASGKEILKQAERFDFLQLLQIQSLLPKNALLIVGRNFTDTQPENKHLVKNLVPMNWCDILFDKQEFEPVGNVVMASHGVSQFAQFIKLNKLDSIECKQWMTEQIIPKSQKQIYLLDKSIYNYKKASKHPTPQGHKLWADYLTEYITTLS